MKLTLYALRRVVVSGKSFDVTDADARGVFGLVSSDKPDGRRGPYRPANSTPKPATGCSGSRTGINGLLEGVSAD